MIGGGTGIASVLFLSSTRKANGKNNDRLMWAGQTSDALPDEYKHPLLLEFATDDGSKGENGNAALVLEKWLKSGKPDALAACGPHGMMKAVKEIAAKHNIKHICHLKSYGMRRRSMCRLCCKA